MSYPRFIQTLIVEDEPGPKSYYEAVFETLVKKGFPFESPHFAFSFEEGKAALLKDTIYQLVVLDLRLPEKPMEPAPDSVSYGLNLLDLCITRNEFPVPAILVISGHLDQANQTDLSLKLQRNFAYGHVLVKGQVDTDIEKAITKALCYCDIGLHIRDGGADEFPTLSPREEDLLRRVALDRGICSGLDLRWWANEYAPPARADDPYAGWTKTLMGRFLLTKGRGKSRPNFFKFTPAAGSESVAMDARLLEAKLPHIKIAGAWGAGDRSLLVTEKVGENDGVPVSLAEFLAQSPVEVTPSLSNIVGAVANQLEKLGEARPEQLVVGKLLWKSHDIPNLKTQWERWNGPKILTQLGLGIDPVQLLDSLRKSNQQLRVIWANALHGDLNVTNVALDVGEAVKSYIFDASGSTGGVNVRDLAMLEVTAILHQTGADDGSVVANCAQLYAQSSGIGLQTQKSNRAINTLDLLMKLRSLPQIQQQQSIYALMVFDQTMIQLGGLGFAGSRNKIRRPEDTAVLAALSVNWLHAESQKTNWKIA